MKPFLSFFCFIIVTICPYNAFGLKNRYNIKKIENVKIEKVKSSERSIKKNFCTAKISKTKLAIASNQNSISKKYELDSKKSKSLKLSKLTPKKQILSQVEPEKAELVVDLKTGKILHSINPNKSIRPASLTKIMTAYVVFKAIKQRKISLNTEIIVPEHATRVPRSKLYLKPGEKIKIKDALNAIIISSANDAAEAVGAVLAGSREKLPNFMNTQAKMLGMHNTTFMNASGLHHDNQKTTAKDLIKLAFSIRKHFPDLYKHFSETSYEYNGKTYVGHNAVTATYRGAEGLKTGFTSKSGYNLCTVATRGNSTLVGLVIGSKSAKERNERMVSLLDKYFIKLRAE